MKARRGAFLFAGWPRPTWDQHSVAWTGTGGHSSSRTPPSAFLNFRVAAAHGTARGWGGDGAAGWLWPLRPTGAV